MTELRHQANNYTNRRSFFNFCEIPRICQNSAEKGKFRGSVWNSAARIKNVGLTYHYFQPTYYTVI